jgi:ribonuclease HI
MDIYTDGSVFKKKYGNVGGIGVFFGNNDKRNLSEPFFLHRTTSPRCELFAIIRGIQIFMIHHNVVKMSKDYKFTIYSDNQYAVYAMTKWIFGWQKRGWKKSNGKEIENQDLIKWLFNLKMFLDKYITFELKWVRAHRNGKDIPKKGTKEYKHFYGNKKADKLAKRGSSYLGKTN